MTYNLATIHLLSTTDDTSCHRCLTA